MSARRYRAFGLELASTFALPGLREREAAGPPSVSLRLASPAEIERSWSGPQRPERSKLALIEGGIAFRSERGRAGDVRFSFGDQATFHLSADAHELLCAPTLAEDAAWQRVLLDSVLGATSLAHGFELLHAGAVQRPDGVLAIAAGTGGGKTSVVAELVRRGAALFCDDLLALQTARDGGAPTAFPGPALLNLPAAGSTAPDELGTALARFGEEWWLAVDHAAVDPAQVATIVWVQRGRHARSRIEPLHAPHRAVLGSLVPSGDDPARVARRFDLADALASKATAYSLTCELDKTPAELADLIETACAGMTGVRG